MIAQLEQVAELRRWFVWHFWHVILDDFDNRIARKFVEHLLRFVVVYLQPLHEFIEQRLIRFSH